MPILDYSNPLYTFDASHLSYTATKDCYLIATVGGVNAQLYVNDKCLICSWYGSIANYPAPNTSLFIKISSGDVVRMVSYDANLCAVSVFGEK